MALIPLVDGTPTGLAGQPNNLVLQAKNIEAQMLRYAAALQAYLLPPGSTVAQVQNLLNSFGGKAVAMLQRASAFAAYLTVAGVTPSFPPPGWTFTPNTDGTVTVAGTGTVTLSAPVAIAK